MTISDSLPFQFWLNGQETFNEKSVCGITKQDCFCQPSQCSDTVNLQFTDTSGVYYLLRIYDPDDVQLSELEFTETVIDDTNSIYTLEFTFSSQGICDEDVRLKIVSSDTSFLVSGAVTALLPDVAGTVTFIEEIPEISIEGDLTALLADVTGSITFVEVTSGMFGLSSDVITDACDYVFLLYYTGVFETGTTMYTDSLLTTPLTGFIYISEDGGDGTIYDLNSGTGVVGDPAGSCL